jgi:hypothetical protein
MQTESWTGVEQSILIVAKPTLTRGLAWLAIVCLLNACGGGGGGSGDDSGGSSTAPTARILFPPSQGVTDADTITVTGTTADAGTVTVVRVNGVDVTSADGFATWRAVVPLAPGANSLVVETRDQAGNMNMNAAVASLLNQPVYTSPWDLALDAAGNRLLMTDRISRSLIGFDLADVSRDKISGRADSFNRTEEIVYDAAGDRVIVAASNRLYSIDLVTGVHTLFSGSAAGAGPFFGSDIRALGYDDTPGAGAERVLLVEGNQARIYTVDLATGDRAILSENNDGNGDNFVFPVSIAVDTANNRALVADSIFPLTDIVAVDLTSGIRTPISPNGGLNGVYTDLAIDIANQKLYAIGSGAVIEIVLAAGPNLGDRSTLSGVANGSGPDFSVSSAIEFDPVANRLLVADDALDALFAVDLASGSRTIIDDNGFGSGVAYNSSLVEIELDPDTDQVYVYDRDRILSVGLDSAVRTTVTDDADIMGNQVGGNAAGIGIDLENNQMLVATANPGTGAGRLIGADLTTGERSVIADPSPATNQVSSIIRDTTSDRAITVISTLDKPRLNQIDLTAGVDTVFSGGILFDVIVGAGDDFQFIPLRGIALDAANDRVLVMQDWGSFFRMFAVDLATGDRSLALEANEAPEFGNILGKMVLDTTRNRLLILDERNEIVALPAVVYIDLGDDSRATLSNADIGEGIELKTPKDIAFHPGRDLAVVLDRGLNALVAIDLESGDRVLFSK